MDKLKKFILSPWTTMTITAAMYLIKYFAKGAVGNWVHSPGLSADSLHNFGDLGVVLAVAFFGLYLGNKPKSEKYPMGRKRFESLLVLVIGVFLGFLAIKTLIESISGFLSLLPSLDQAVRTYIPVLPKMGGQLVTGKAFVVVVLTTGLSALLSLIIAKYEIFVGKRTGTISIVADGRETASDGKIELATFVGFMVKFSFIFFLGQYCPRNYLTISSFIEYSISLLITIVIAHTAWELLGNAINVLTATSIGKEKVSQIRTIVKRVEGVKEIESIRTFSDGTTATCILEVFTPASSKAHTPMRTTIERRIKKYLSQFEEYLGQEVYCSFKKPAAKFIRKAQAIVIDDEEKEMHALTIRQATHIRIYDMDDDDNRHRAIDIELTGMSLEAIVAKMIYKRVQYISVFAGSDEEKAAFEKVGIGYHQNLLLRVFCSTRTRANL